VKEKEMDPIKQWWVEERAKKAVEKLEAHEFEAIYVRTKEEAVEEIKKHLVPKQSIGAGGSLTIRELGILDQLEAQSYTLYDHWKPGLSKENILKIQKLHRICRVVVIHERKPSLTDILIILVGEELGF
jgi:hypothetical protein